MSGKLKKMKVLRKCRAFSDAGYVARVMSCRSLQQNAQILRKYWLVQRTRRRSKETKTQYGEDSQF